MTGPKQRSTLSDLDDRLKAARARQEQAESGAAKQGQQPTGIGLGFRLAMELVAGLAVGIGIGLGLDYLLGTSPLLMIVFFFLGAAAGILNVYRVSSGQGYGVGFPKRGKENQAADDEGMGDKG